MKDTSFANTRFAESQLLGINWTQSEWAANSLLSRPVNFQSCVLNYSTFMGLNLEKVIINHCVAHEVSFEDANLSYTDCTGTDFENSRFARTNLTGADFRRAINYQIDPSINTLKRTKFNLPEAMSLLYNLDIVLDEPLSDE